MYTFNHKYPDIFLNPSHGKTHPKLNIDNARCQEN